MRDTVIDWEKFLGRALATIDPGILKEYLLGRRVLITGAGGSIGTALAKRLADSGVDRLVLLDLAQGGLFDLAAELECKRQPPAELIVGDVCNSDLLRETFARHRPDTVFHAAACKHVSLMESNPFTAAQSNILGTHRVLQAAGEAGVGQVIVLSTDKAVEPVGIMGATKRVGELIVLGNAGPMQVKAVRLANVLGSSGSVVPILLRQIARGMPLTLTDPACTRYFISMEEAVTHLVSSLAVPGSSTVLVPESGSPMSIFELAQFVLQQALCVQAEIVYTGLRGGEKLTERMASSDELLMMTNLPYLQQVTPPFAVSPFKVATSMEEIETAIRRRELGRLLHAITGLVPAYRPSHQILKQAGHEAKTVF